MFRSQFYSTVIKLVFLPAPQRDYEIFAPSHPQAVNQYVREYNYYAGDDDGDAEYDETMKDYERTVNREYSNVTLLLYLFTSGYAMVVHGRSKTPKI